MDVGEAIGKEMTKLTDNVERLLNIEKEIYFAYLHLTGLQKEWKGQFGITSREDRELLYKITGRPSVVDRFYITRKGLKAIKNEPKPGKDIDWS